MSASSNNNSPASARSNTPSDTIMSCETPTVALVLSLGIRPLLLRSADTACMKKKADMVMMLLMMIMMIKI